MIEWREACSLESFLEYELEQRQTASKVAPRKAWKYGVLTGL
jgi:hypothetical protein